LFKAPVAISCD